ncbi:hypothetical protein PIB30_046381 [Stylosanthes scabra]|uniref:Uncharacterized protein n=1 Tax=Stylosanthes scabra TaxID=79078 RepID=A0ABU6QH87_9FABA|nr:hypothetical protein [Stylosanthes scabra]
MAVVGGASILQKARWETGSGAIAVTIRKNTRRLVDTKEWQYPTYTVAKAAEAGMLHPKWSIQPPSEIRQIIKKRIGSNDGNRGHLAEMVSRHRLWVHQ